MAYFLLFSLNKSTHKRKKEDFLMLSVINQAGYAITVLDFTPENSSLPVWLVVLTAFSAAMLVIETVRYHFSQKTTSVGDTMPTEVEYRKAA